VLFNQGGAQRSPPFQILLTGEAIFSRKPLDRQNSTVTFSAFTSLLRLDLTAELELTYVEIETRNL
jgi:hypothetical protein